MNARTINLVTRIGLATALALAGLLTLFAAVSQANAAVEPTARVNVYALNLRAGPGLNYRVLDVLLADEEVALMGRNTDGLWVEVNQAAGPGGWMYAPYLDTDAAIAGLPLTEASGGPISPSQTANTIPANNNFPLFTVITDNIAVVTLQRFPANADVVVELGRVGETAAIVVAQGRTDATGSAQLTFDMPSRWADGTPLVENRLTLAAATADHGFSQTSTIDYFRF